MQKWSLYGVYAGKYPLSRSGCACLLLLVSPHSLKPKYLVFRGFFGLGSLQMDTRILFLSNTHSARVQLGSQYLTFGVPQTTVVQFPMAGVVDRPMYLNIRGFSSRLSKFARQALSMIRYRLGSFWSVILGKFWQQKQSRKQDNPLSSSPQIKLEPPCVGANVKLIAEKSGPYSHGSSIPTYTLVEEGNIISRDSASGFSLYPSSGGINNAPYPVPDSMSNNDPALGDSRPNVVIAEQYFNNVAMRSHGEVKVSLANIRIKPVMPEATQRYDRRSTM